MNIVDFTNSIYLGDRACKKIVIDTWSDKICIQVDVISRIRSPDGSWNFYSEEDIYDGYIVLKKIQSITWSENGKIPNDRINYLDVSELDDEVFLFTLSVDSVGQDGSNSEVVLQIKASKIYLIDLKNPEIEIVV